MIRLLRANKRQHGIHHPLLAIDCENDPASGAFICAGIHGEVRHRTSHRENGKVKVDWSTRPVDEYFTEQGAFLDFLSSLKRNSCLLVFYNLSYDKVFIDPLVDHNTVLCAGSRVIVLTLKANGIKAIDLCNHVDGSLADWIKHLDMTAKHGIAKTKLKEYRARVMNDARATFRLGTFIEDFYYYECGIPLTVTVGAAAMRLFTMKHFTDYWERDNDFMAEYERRAFFGGRVEVFQRGTFATWGYDVNSMYLSIMRDCLLPDMATGKYIDKAPVDWQRYLNDYLGIWQVRVYCPDSVNIPVLPFRIDGKLKFPVGEFRGCYTSVELLAALRAGYQILEVYDFVFYRRSKLYMKTFAEFVWSKRAAFKASGNKGMDLLTKKLGNALYGKFAQRNSADYFGRVKDYKGNMPDGVQFYDHPTGDTWVLVKGDKQPAKFEFPAISAFITAYARLKLYDAMIANESTLIYCDTDSIKLTAPARGIAISDKLGDWGVETEGEQIAFYRPKLYGNKRKGIPRGVDDEGKPRARMIEHDSRGETWQFLKPLREREAIKAGSMPNKWVDVQKHLTLIDDKRRWENGISKPIALTILYDTDLGRVDPLSIPIEQRYPDKPKMRHDRDIRSPEDQAALELERLDKRRAGDMIYQRG